MKKFFLIFFCSVIYALGACAQPAPEGSSQQMLESGLKELRKSYNQLVERNNFLVAEIASYQQKMPPLLKQLEALSSQKEVLAADKRVEENFGSQTDMGTVYRREIAQLRRHLQAPAEGGRQKIFLQRKEELDTLIHRSRENTPQAQLRLRNAERQYVQQTETIDRLRSREKQNRQAAPEPGDVGRDGKRTGEAPPKVAADEHGGEYLASLTDEIVQLKSYQQQLKDKLSLRHSQNSSDTAAWDEDQYRMYLKLSSLREENMLLKRQLSLIGSSPSVEGQVPLK
ncbi:MAG: hypothetical protein HZA29_03130 [Candidatus Omnitrophica bacterium]|nr:hypothetical protein [Candidatus Omnitrophota bacterium]